VTASSTKSSSSISAMVPPLLSSIFWDIQLEFVRLTKKLTHSRVT